MKGPTKIFKRDDDIASNCFIFNLWLILPPECWPAPSKSLTLPELAASMSIILPGVHTMISAPRFNSAICSEIPVPPGVRVLSKNWGKHNSTYDLSSELTVNTNHPSPSHGFDELSALLSYLQAQFPDEKKVMMLHVSSTRTCFSTWWGSWLSQWGHRPLLTGPGRQCVGKGGEGRPKSYLRNSSLKAYGKNHVRSSHLSQS